MKTLYGIKNCNTIKKARQCLAKHNIEYQFHDYRSDGLDIVLLNRFAEKLGWETLLNRRSASWRQLSNTQKSNLSEEKALQLMLQHPTLIKRPILDTGDKILIGFSETQYQTELLHE